MRFGWQVLKRSFVVIRVLSFLLPHSASCRLLALTATSTSSGHCRRVGGARRVLMLIMILLLLLLLLLLMGREGACRRGTGVGRHGRLLLPIRVLLLRLLLRLLGVMTPRTTRISIHAMSATVGRVGLHRPGSERAGRRRVRHTSILVPVVAADDCAGVRERMLYYYSVGRSPSSPVTYAMLQCLPTERRTCIRCVVR